MKPQEKYLIYQQKGKYKEVCSLLLRDLRNIDESAVNNVLSYLFTISVLNEFTIDKGLAPTSGGNTTQPYFNKM